MRRGGEGGGGCEGGRERGGVASYDANRYFELMFLFCHIAAVNAVGRVNNRAVLGGGDKLTVEKKVEKKQWRTRKREKMRGGVVAA